MEQLPEDLNLHIFDIIDSMDNLYHLVQLNKYFHTLYINKYKSI